MPKWRFKFSLRTLLLFSICSGCGLLFWRTVSPWQLDRQIDLGHSQEEIREGEPGLFLRDYVKMEFSKDSRVLLLTSELFKSGADADEPRELEVWDVHAGAKMCTLKHDAKIGDWAISDDGKLIATMTAAPKDSGFTSVLRIWKAQPGELVMTTPLKDFDFRPPVFSYDSKRVVVGSCILDVASGKVLRNLQSSFGIPCFPANGTIEELLAEERRQAAGSATAATLAEFEERTRECFVRVLASERWIFTGTSSTGLSIWDVSTEKKVGVLDGKFDRNSIETLSVSPDYSRVVMSYKLHDDATKLETLIAELPSGRTLVTVAGRFDYSGEVQRFSADGSRQLIELDGVPMLWIAGKTPNKWKLPVTLGLTPRSISPDGTRIAARRADPDDDHQSVAVANALSGETLAVLKCGVDHASSVLRFADGGNEIITDTDTNSLLIWRRHRPEKWWGVVWLPQFWALLAAIGLFAGSIARDRRALR